METWPSVHFKETGYAVLRSGTKTVVMKYGPHGGGHGHPDKLSISIHDGERRLYRIWGHVPMGYLHLLNGTENFITQHTNRRC